MKSVSSTLAILCAASIGGGAAYWSHLRDANEASELATHVEPVAAPLVETFAPDSLSAPNAIRQQKEVTTSFSQSAAVTPRKTSKATAADSSGEPQALGTDWDIDVPQQFVGQINLGSYVDPLAVDSSIQGYVNLGTSVTTDP